MMYIQHKRAEVQSLDSIIKSNFSWDNSKLHKKFLLPPKASYIAVEANGPWRSNQVHYKDVALLQGEWAEFRKLSDSAGFGQW